MCHGATFPIHAPGGGNAPGPRQVGSYFCVMRFRSSPFAAQQRRARRTSRGSAQGSPVRC